MDCTVLERSSSVSLPSVLEESNLRTHVIQWSLLSAATISADGGTSGRRFITKVFIV